MAVRGWCSSMSAARSFWNRTADSSPRTTVFASSPWRVLLRDELRLPCCRRLAAACWRAPEFFSQAIEAYDGFGMAIYRIARDVQGKPRASGVALGFRGSLRRSMFRERMLVMMRAVRSTVFWWDGDPAP